MDAPNKINTISTVHRIFYSSSPRTVVLLPTSLYFSQAHREKRKSLYSTLAIMHNSNMLRSRSYVFSDRETENSQKFSGRRIFSPKIILENFTSLVGTHRATTTVKILLEHSTPTISAHIKGMSRRLITDTGTNVLILQPAYRWVMQISPTV
jgi:hypothetical protein